MMKTELLKKINNNSEVIGILGMGYVGLPLAVSFSKKGLKTYGFDKNQNKISKLMNSQNYISDVDCKDLEYVINENYFIPTTDFALISQCDILIICVPTPLDKFKKPDMSFIASACELIGKHMRSGVFISLESTTYPTTTEVFVKNIIEKISGKSCENDFWLAFSPERVDPGNDKFKTENTPKVLGGVGKDSAEIGVKVYSKAVKEIYPVSSPRVAEMVKILENTYRLVNISLINELALLSEKMSIDIWEVIDAAKTKPFGFSPFYPGPGIGGHCIPLDPFYLEYIAKNYNFDLTMINTAGNINNIMPHKMCVKITYALNRIKKAMNGSRVLFLGVAYKPNIDDARESPVLKVIDEVAKKKAEIFYHDPYIPEIVTDCGRKYTNSELSDGLLESMDCVVFSTNHNVFDVAKIVEKSKLVVDFRNSTKGISLDDKIIKL